MAASKKQEELTLLDILVDAFEKNETLGGFHWRSLPMPNDTAAIQKFVALADEATRWMGTPSRREERDGRRLVAWTDLEIRQVGRALMVRARAPRVDQWWHDPATWAGNPMGPIHAWIQEENT